MVRAAIVYLSQVRHASYGRDSLSLLGESLRLLHKNYNDRERHDCIIFHTGDFGMAEQARVLAPLPDRPIRFELVPPKYWRLPVDIAPFLSTSNRDEWSACSHVSK